MITVITELLSTPEGFVDRFYYHRANLIVKGEAKAIESYPIEPCPNPAHNGGRGEILLIAGLPSQGGIKVVKRNFCCAAYESHIRIDVDSLNSME